MMMMMKMNDDDVKFLENKLKPPVSSYLGEISAYSPSVILCLCVCVCVVTVPSVPGCSSWPG